ncbi:DUF1360 domain-containing protein [Kribbella sp. CA-293567]|uniref:DUF1360 domain-containing protein n=1 Tax=Kribbella sp. CA-293567 TaxID=3002436 RepID=UPI0022DE51C0|nr:DUF1360 domain-containing protein [Kribbella sp. CA-293567]WBQ06568.1 DUF1360 domain-containing protein [Kribbella sp. CA-293567]
MNAATSTEPSTVGWVGRLKSAAQRQSDGYAPERSLSGYAGAIGVFSAYCAALALAGRATGRRLPDEVRPLDLLVGAAAVFRFSKLVSRNTVTSPIRAPFTQYSGPGGPAETIDEARGDGARRVVGELITCPFCLSVWTATTYTAGLVLFPRATRTAAAGLAVLTGADLLQLSSTALTRVATGDDD